MVQYLHFRILKFPLIELLVPFAMIPLWWKRATRTETDTWPAARASSSAVGRRLKTRSTSSQATGVPGPRGWDDEAGWLVSGFLVSQVNHVWVRRPLSLPTYNPPSTKGTSTSLNSHTVVGFDTSTRGIFSTIEIHEILIFFKNQITMNKPPKRLGFQPLYTLLSPQRQVQPGLLLRPSRVHLWDWPCPGAHNPLW